jgi:hypothetical protein
LSEKESKQKKLNFVSIRLDDNDYDYIKNHAEENYEGTISISARHMIKDFIKRESKKK